MDLYVMTDDNFSKDYYITTWADFEAECNELKWNADAADLTDLDDYLADGISQQQANNLKESARRYGVWDQVQAAVR